ncbi:hypothetical protein Scep_010804 [Stephania cephalantha]|uniref:Uncharacterized protein n=1 Tax=Stephania cephalantha TaxID=152367 RepID=A0AAP0JX33_9MAGN
MHAFMLRVLRGLSTWVGDEEEEKVFSSVLRLKQNNVGVTPLLKRVSSDVSRSNLMTRLPM